MFGWNTKFNENLVVRAYVWAETYADTISLYFVKESRLKSIYNTALCCVMHEFIFLVSEFIISVACFKSFVRIVDTSYSFIEQKWILQSDKYNQ